MVSLVVRARDASGLFAPASSPAPASLLADWQARINAPGVVWYHNFETEAEVDNFRWDLGMGNDPGDLSTPNQCRWRADDGILGGCLEQFRPAGNTEPPEWWRPFSPLTAPGNGRSTNDPADGGSMAVQSYNPTQGGSQIQNWGDRGFYGHPDYHAQDPGAFDGTDYYIQVRVKTSPSRASQPEGGKLFYFTRTDVSATSQEIVTISNFKVSAIDPDRNLFSMYRSISPPLDGDDPGTSRQPGGLEPCDSTNSSGCFFTPVDEWYTLLYHITPGHDSGNDTRVEVWSALEGETTYTKFWDQSNVDLPFGAGHPFGHNALICSGWMNSIVFTADVWHRYCQIIFSKEFIECPQVYNPCVDPQTTLEIAACGLAPGATVAGPSIAQLIAADTRQHVQWGNDFFYDHTLKKAFLYGKDAATGGGGDGTVSMNEYNAATNSWATTGRFDHDGSTETGHVFSSVVWAEGDNRFYRGRWATTATAMRYWNLGTPLNQWQQTSVGYAFSLTNAVNPSLAWHPDLFGPGDGGLVVHRVVSGSNVRLALWRRLDDTWITHPNVANGSPWLSGSQHGTNRYVRAMNGMICTFSNSGNTFFLGAGAAGAPATPINIATPPIPLRYDGSASSNPNLPGQNVGVLIDDPSGAGGPYILEKGSPTGDNRVWRFVNWETTVTSGSWQLQAFRHPFPFNQETVPPHNSQWFIASIFPMGVIWLISQTSEQSLLWRPDDQ